MDEFRIESHKLIYHVARVDRWLEGKDIYPIYVEIAPSGGCNQRCYFCAFDYLNYKPQFIKTRPFMNTLSEMAECGVKSIMYSGEGEPLLHKDITELISHTKRVGIDVALTTNGLFLDKEKAEEIIPHLDWLRISLDAATPRTYTKLHGCHPRDFNKVIENLILVAKLKKRKKYTCTLGAQFLLFPDNYKEAVLAVRKLKEIAWDYLIIKPYSWHPMSKNKIRKNIDYSQYLSLNEKLQKFTDKNFAVIFRSQAMHKITEDKTYRHCLGLPFWAYIDSKGDIYACSTFLGDKRFCYGNIYKNRFREIWKGKRRKSILKIFSKMDMRRCRKACRLDEINRYLWELKYPPEHVNFI